MAKIRVYELARDLNMTNKALLDKIQETNIPVKSHMSTLEDEHVLLIRASIFGKKGGMVEETRVQPAIIRRRRKEPAAPEPGVIEEHGEEPAVAAIAPAQAESPDVAAQPESSDQTVIATLEDGAMVPPELFPELSPEPVEAVPGAPSETPPTEDTSIVIPDAAPPIASSDTPADAATVPSEVVPAVAAEATPEVPEADAPSLVSTSDQIPPEPVTAAPPDPSPAPPPPPADAQINRSGRATKRKRGRKDMPARIIKPAPVVVTPPAAAPPPPEAAPQVRKPVARGAAPPEASTAKDTRDTAEENGAKAKKKKKRDIAPPSKSPEAEAEAKKALKKRPILRKKEVVDVSGLYTDKNRGRKLRKSGRGKTLPPVQKPLITTAKAIKRRLKIDDTIVLAELAKRMGVKVADIIRKLMDSGVMATMNQLLDYDTAVLVASEFDYELERAAFEEESILKSQSDDSQDPAKLTLRPPVVTIMGHVDHGKTSLLDVIRKSHITEDEAGGITQHIGAYHVETSRGRIVFLDTPGHEAFTAMRSRGASVTDLVVLVVAADDGVMPQTHEAINHAKAAGVPIIVAVNKMDKPGADPERVQRELADSGLLSEEWGGETIFVKVSAKEKVGIEELLEMILLQAEVLELKANPGKRATGHVVEAKLDSGRGPVATVLIEDGTLHTGDAVVCGIYYGKIRALLNDRGQQVDSAGPAIPVEVIGLSGVPLAGDQLVALEDEKDARQVSLHRVQKQRTRDLARTNRLSLENLFEQIQEGAVKTLNLLIKADVHGSIEALRDSLLKLSNNEVSINVVHAATGAITESDVSLASVSEAIIIGFNVRPSAKVQASATEEHVDIRYYNIIYNAIQDVQNAILGMMASTFITRVLGHAEVREVFHVPKIGAIAGCYITDGKIQRGRQARLLRDGVVCYEGKIGSLRRFKDDVKEVLTSYECGIGIENYNDLKVGDVIECYYMEERKPELQAG